MSRSYFPKLSLITTALTIFCSVTASAQYVSILPDANYYPLGAYTKSTIDRIIPIDASGTATFQEKNNCPATFNGGSLYSIYDTLYSETDAKYADGNVVAYFPPTFKTNGFTRVRTGSDYSGTLVSSGGTLTSFPVVGITNTLTNIQEGILFEYYNTCYYTGCAPGQSCSLNVSEQVGININASIDIGITRLELFKSVGGNLTLDQAGNPVLPTGEYVTIYSEISAPLVSPGDNRVVMLNATIGTRLVASTQLNANRVVGPRRLAFLPIDEDAGKTLTLTVTVLSNDSNPANNSSSIKLGTLKQPTVSIDSVRLGQVVWNPSSPVALETLLVQNKSATLEVTLAGDSTSTAQFHLSVTSGSGTILNSGKHSLNSLVSSQMKIPFSEMRFSMKTSGHSKLNINLVSDDPAALVSQASYVLPIDVEATTTPTIGLVPIGHCDGAYDCYGTVSGSNLSALLGLSQFISDMMPVADNSIVLKPVSGPIVGSAKSLVKYKAGQALYGEAYREEILKVLNYKHIIGIDRLVGIVPAKYFKNTGVLYRDPITKVTKVITSPTGLVSGTTDPSRSVALVQEDFSGALAHELTHTFGDSDEYYRIPSKHNVKFEGVNANLPSPLIMNKLGILDNQKNAGDAWMDIDAYARIFSTFQQIFVDPPTQLISGTLNSNGSFTFDSAHALTNGVVSSDVVGGNLVIRALDKNGLQLFNLKQASTAQTIAYSANDNDGLVAFDTGSIPMAVELPYNAAMRSISIELAGKQIASVVPQSQNLISLIKAIPQSAYIGMKSCELTALLNVAKEVERQIQLHHDKDASLLVYGIALGLEFGTRNDFQLVDGSAMNKKTTIQAITKLAVDLR